MIYRLPPKAVGAAQACQPPLEQGMAYDTRPDGSAPSSRQGRPVGSMKAIAWAASFSAA